MRYVKWTAIVVVLALVAGFLHWTLPSRDIVRVLGTDVKRMDAGASSDTGTGTRDVRFISAVTPDGAPRVYRNEDTGFGWPPYFKFDSANLDAIAQNAISAEDNPNWVTVRHYGWRVPWLSAFPNALSIKPVADPDQLLIPWTAGIVVILLAVVAFFLQRTVRRLVARYF